MKVHFAGNHATFDLGAAALSLTPLMGVSVWTEDGQPVEGAHIQVALPFVDPSKLKKSAAKP